jgi:hypothetical protein
VQEDLTLEYALELLPPGGFPFWRWRWELWKGSELLATGWRTSERQAQRAVRSAAARAMRALSFQLVAR